MLPMAQERVDVNDNAQAADNLVNDSSQEMPVNDHKNALVEHGKDKDTPLNEVQPNQIFQNDGSQNVRGAEDRFLPDTVPHVLEEAIPGMQIFYQQDACADDTDSIETIFDESAENNINLGQNHTTD